MDQDRVGWPTFADTCSNTVRGKRSVALPGENGTMTWTRLFGQLCAASGAAATIVSADVSATTTAPAGGLRAFARLCMFVLLQRDRLRGAAAAQA
jgi:hypothetical protein